MVLLNAFAWIAEQMAFALPAHWRAWVLIAASDCQLLVFCLYLMISEASVDMLIAQQTH